MKKVRLIGIKIYPVKSLSGISLPEAFAGERGFEHDRRWMLIDSENNFITQRTYPQLALTNLKIQEGFIKVKHKNENFGEVKIPLKTDDGPSVTSKVWDDDVQLLWPGLPADNWFSEILQSKVRLVYMPDRSLRRIDPEFVREKMYTSLSDGYPYLLINRRSVDDITKKSGIKIETERFRPNLIIETDLAFEEDSLKEVQIGKLRFRAVKPCARCVMTTIDPETGLTGKEPLKTLSIYRKFGNKILFGQNMIVDGSGTVHVGDEIKLIH